MLGIWKYECALEQVSGFLIEPFRSSILYNLFYWNKQMMSFNDFIHDEFPYFIDIITLQYKTEVCV